MNLPANPWPTLTFHQRIIVILAALCFVGLLVLGVMALMLRQRLQAAGAPEQAATLPAELCRPATLTLGQTTFLIRDLSRAADGSLAVPPDTPGIAYRVQGSDRQPVFVLSPSPENLAVVPTVPLNSPVMVTGSDCTFSTYRVSAHEPGTFHASGPAGPSQDGLTVYFPLDASGAGFVFTAELTGEPAYILSRPSLPARNTLPAPVVEALPSVVESTSPPSATTAPPVENGTPPPVANTGAPPVENESPAPEENILLPSEEQGPSSPGSSEVLAEIGLLDLATSPDGKTITVSISIYNYGASVFALTGSDLSLTQPDGRTLALVSSEPSLPKQVAPAATEQFSLTFPRPSSAIATLKIFTVEYDLEDY